MTKHISFSALRLWNECPFKYKLSYIDNIKKFNGSEYTAFGTALHKACEKKLLNDSEQEQEIFLETFEKELASLPVDYNKNEVLITEMRGQGKMLSSLAIPALREKFGNFTVVAAEADLFEALQEFPDWNFKGFIDLVIKTEDGKIHILDWKSCAWGWDAEKKSDPLVTYQLTYYKYFYARKHNIDPKMIETYFALLKRTAKDDNVEIFRVTSGDKKTDNALILLKKTLLGIDKGFYLKNRLSCKYCEFKKTKECP
jgi:ATP-dependent exoDNAse (exonuclease V) beta subunit